MELQTYATTRLLHIIVNAQRTVLYFSLHLIVFDMSTGLILYTFLRHLYGKTRRQTHVNSFPSHVTTN